MNLKLIVVGKDAEDLSRFQGKAFADVKEIHLLNNENRAYGGLGEIANRYIDMPDWDVLGIVHADTLLNFDAPQRLGAVAKQYGAITGLVGRALTGKYVWGKNLTDGTIETVSTLDSCSIFIPSSVRSFNLRFDTQTFDGFHCCVEDFCLQAAAQGYLIFVPSVDAGHIGQTTEQPEWQNEYYQYRHKLQQKWNHVSFVTT